MTRYRLTHLARISAAVLGTLLLGAGIRQLGLSTTLRVATFCMVGGAAAAVGWHLVAYIFIRREEQLLADRRHRAPRSPRVERRQARADTSREEYVDAYLDQLDADRPEPSPALGQDPCAQEYAAETDWFGVGAHPAGTA